MPPAAPATDPVALVVSPHLDDAVFGCGDWLADHPGAVAATVFAGVPPAAGTCTRTCTEWDARCGFTSAAEALAERRAEDARALHIVGARPVWLDFLDSQYGRSPPVGDVARALGALIDELRIGRLVFPLGLFHSDHLLTHQACLQAWQARQDTLQALAYEDGLYRNAPGALQRRLAGLLAEGIAATPVKRAPPRDPARKAQAVQAYRSQLRAFGPGGYDDTARPERLWRLQPLATLDQETA